MVCSLSGRSLRSVRLNQEYEKAWDYVNRQMVLIDEAGVAALQEAGGTLGGQFESNDGRMWKWSAQVKETEIEGLYDVFVSVEWPSSARIRKVTCQSRLAGEMAMMDSQQGDPGQP